MEQYPFIFSNERKHRIRRHVTFWLFWWLFQGLLYAFVSATGVIAYARQVPLSLLESFVFLANHMFLSYSLMYFVIPRFLLKQQYWKTAIATFSLFIITAVLSAVLGSFVIAPIRQMVVGDFPRLQFAHPTVYLSLLAGLRGGITIGGIAAAIKLAKYWYVKEQRNLQLQKENADSQLQLLKAQVHPHFLFNTLNNIYSHAHTTSPVAARLVSGLSDMLRFMLYECNQRFVPLARELTMVKDYLSLEQIRYGNKLDVHVELPDKTDDLQIAPLLLLPLIENCFKHGTSQMLEQPWISLHIAIRGRQLQMKLLNGKPPQSNKTSTTGIGLENVRKRLELLYPGKHEFSITEEKEVFIVNLKIELQRQAILTEKPAVREALTHA